MIVRVLAVFLALSFFGLSCSPRGEHLVIGSKNFSEQVILGELLAQQIESHTGIKVDRRLNLGGTFICHHALTAGQIDAYVEYTGTAFTAILKHEPLSDPATVLRRVREEYGVKHNLEWTEPLGFNNTFAILVRAQDAVRLNIKTIEDASKYTPQWKAGFGYEFMERADGFQGLSRTYGLRFSSKPRVMDLALTYRALADHKVDLIAGNSTDGLIEKLGLAALQDNKGYFPPYEAAPVVRRDVLARHPGLRKALEQLGRILSEKEMRRLNYLVDGEHKDVRSVVTDFLKSKGL